MTPRAARGDAVLLDTLYDEDAETARVELPPGAWWVARRDIDELIAFARIRLDLAWCRVRDQARTARLAHDDEPRRGSVVLAAVPRVALLARLTALQVQHGAQLQVAHRKLDVIADDELRSLVADLESLAADADVDADADPTAGKAGA